MGDADESPSLTEIKTHLERLDPAAGLDAISPEAGVNQYLDARASELTAETRDAYERDLQHFVAFCDHHDIDELRQLDGATLEAFRIWLRDESSDAVSSFAPKTMRDKLYLTRDFIQYLERIDAVPSGLHTAVHIPELAGDDGVSDDLLASERASAILAYLRRFEYATREHVVWLLFCKTGARRGALHALDVSDCHLTTDDPYLAFHHRPDQGTRLKNGPDSERHVTISEAVRDVLADYIDTNRIAVTDEYGREPLITTRHGRASKSTLTKYAYKWSRPCVIDEPCPHDRTPDECAAATDSDDASKCPSSRSPHMIRTGYLTAEGKHGTPTDALSGRCDVSERVLEHHYQVMDAEDHRQLRKRVLQEIHDETDGYAE